MTMERVWRCKEPSSRTAGIMLLHCCRHHGAGIGEFETGFLYHYFGTPCLEKALLVFCVLCLLYLMRDLEPKGRVFHSSSCCCCTPLISALAAANCSGVGAKERWHQDSARSLPCRVCCIMPYGKLHVTLVDGQDLKKGTFFLSFHLPLLVAARPLSPIE